MSSHNQGSGTSARILAILGLLAASWGCAVHPESAPWDSTQEILTPIPSNLSGRLKVETADVTPHLVGPDEGEQRNEPFYVYRQSGKFYKYCNNDYFAPISLPPGKYSVVTRYRGENKKVQIEIRDGETTSVRLDDFRRAPSID